VIASSSRTLAWIAECGLVLDVAGAIVLAYGLIISRDDALRLGVGRWAGDTDEENVKLPQVRDRLRQSRNAKIGLVLLFCGFVLQIVGNWP
jgi:hypothetical protein